LPEARIYAGAVITRRRDSADHPAGWDRQTVRGGPNRHARKFIAVDGHSYDSLSAAGRMARKTIAGAPAGKPYPSTNRWAFWQFRDPTTGELLEVESLRQQFLASKK